jgi:hypothetical protein
MPFTIRLAARAQDSLAELAARDGRKHLKVLKTLALLQANPRHAGLHTHEYTSLKGPHQEKVFEAYVENRTPAAFRVFWYYGPEPGHITVVDISPHP